MMAGYDRCRKWRSEDEIDGRAGRKWKKLKDKVLPCPYCNSRRQWLARSTMSKIKRYWVECDACYWCGKPTLTIRMAIRAWNKDYKTWGIRINAKHICQILKMLKEQEGGELK